MNRYKSNYSLIDALQEGQSMVNALEPSDLSALHCRIRKFDFHLKSGGWGVRFSKKLLLGEQEWLLPTPNQATARRYPLSESTSCPCSDASQSLSTRGCRGGGDLWGNKGPGDEALHVGKDRKLHTNTLHNHVSLRGGGFYCYFKGCVCIENKIFL